MLNVVNNHVNDLIPQSTHLVVRQLECAIGLTVAHTGKPPFHELFLCMHSACEAAIVQISFYEPLWYANQIKHSGLLGHNSTLWLSNWMVTPILSLG